MGDQSHGSARAYGWQDFDPEVVAGLVENDSRFINRRAGGWIACPLSGHFGEELAWQEDNYRKGSVLHGSPPASFRAAPTYVLERPLDNLDRRPRAHRGGDRRAGGATPRRSGSATRTARARSPGTCSGRCRRQDA